MCIWSSSIHPHVVPNLHDFLSSAEQKIFWRTYNVSQLGLKQHWTSPTYIVWTFFELWRLFLNYPFKGQYVKHCCFYQSLSNMLFLWYWQTLHLYYLSTRAINSACYIYPFGKQCLSYDLLMLPLENHIPQTDSCSKIARLFSL